MKLLASFAALLLLAFTANAQDKTASKKDSITLERGACFGTCPIYKVSVRSDGRVTFEGFNYTKVKGKATGRIKAKDFKNLVQEFEQIKYFSLDDTYEPGQPNCDPAVTDLPRVKSSIRLRGKTKSISHYQGCLNSEVVRALFVLDRRIDEVAGTVKWIK